MKRKLWLLSLILPISVAMMPQAAPALSLGHVTDKVCGTGAFFTSCTKTCANADTTTILHDTGEGSSCATAKSACSSCRPCPSGESQTSLTFGACGS